VIFMRFHVDLCIYRVFQEESVILRKNQTYVLLKFIGYGENDAKKCDLLPVPRTVLV
jgi:hypothetical protein